MGLLPAGGTRDLDVGERLVDCARSCSDAQHFGGKLPRAIATAMDAGLIARQPVEPLARLLLGAVTEAAVACAGRADIARAGAEYARAFKSLVEALRVAA